MNVVDTLSKANYVATPEQIGQLARMNLHSIKGSDLVNGVYLKCLIVGVQKDLESSVTELEQDKVLQQVHERYYGAVVQAVTSRDIRDDKDLLKDERRARALERNRRSNFARSAKATLLGFIRAEGDVMTLDAEKITKGELHNFAVSMKVPTNVMQSLPARVNSTLGDLEELTKQLADVDKTLAVRALTHSIERLTMLAIEFGVSYTDRSEVAVRDAKILRTSAGTFWPVMTERPGAH